MTDLARFYWGYAIYSGISRMLDDGSYPIDVLEELIQKYKKTIGISASELERKLEILKQQKSA